MTYHPVIYLHCAAPVGQDTAQIQMPVSRELWESGAEMQQTLRDRARAELENFVYSETGIRLPDDHVAALDVTVDDPADRPPPPTRSTVELVGGPADGQRMGWDTYPPPPAIEHYQTSGLDITDTEPRPLRRLLYLPILDDMGFQSRSDDGAWFYRFRPDSARG